MNRIHQARASTPQQASWLGWPAPAGVHYRGAGKAADDPFCQALSPSGASLMNDTAAGSVHPVKGGRPWRS